MPYVDGYLIPVPKRKLPDYMRLARKAGKVFMEYGALEYRECAGDDLKIKGMASFTQAVKTTPGETVVFSWIVFKSKTDRNKINARVMKDPRLASMIHQSATLFNPKRMVCGGFKTMVNL
jgi:uncharacterized protein YbaA (DUF1428 family)